MGTCIYCGQKAGFLRKKHTQCESDNRNGKWEIVRKVSQAIVDKQDYSELDSQIKEIVQKCYICEDTIVDLHIRGFDQAVTSFFEDGIISQEEEDKIYDFKEFYNYDQDTLNQKGSISNVVKGSILRQVIEGKDPVNKINIQGDLPILLQKNESVIWLFQSVSYFEQRTRTVYEGRSHGVSVKIAKGLYYRTSAFKGNPVKIDELAHKANGMLFLTNKHLYFVSSLTNFKIPYNKIISLNSFEDGIGIQKDGVSSKPQLFKNIDGWFTYNLISNLNGNS